MKTLIVLQMALLGAGTLRLHAQEATAKLDPDLPQAVSPDDLIQLFSASPFTRSLNLSDSLVLTGIAYIDGKPVATLLNKNTRETFMVSQEPNAMGWRLAETNATAGQLNRAQAKIMVGAEVITVRYAEDLLTPEAMKKGGFKPGGGTVEENAKGGGGDRGGGGERRYDGAPRREGPQPSDESRQRFMSLSDKSREKFIEQMRESRDKMMNASPEERMQYAKKIFERVEAEDKGGRK